MLGLDGWYKLARFGTCSRLPGPDAQPAQQAPAASPGLDLLKSELRPPELPEGRSGPLTPQADVWQLGKLLEELIKADSGATDGARHYSNALHALKNAMLHPDPRARPTVDDIFRASQSALASAAPQGNAAGTLAVAAAASAATGEPGRPGSGVGSLQGAGPGTAPATQQATALRSSSSYGSGSTSGAEGPAARQAEGKSEREHEHEHGHGHGHESENKKEKEEEGKTRGFFSGVKEKVQKYLNRASTKYFHL